MIFNFVSHSKLEYFKTKLMAWANAAFDAIGAASAVLGTASDTSAANTVYGAKAAAADVLGTASDTASDNTVYGAKAAAADVLGTASDSLRCQGLQ